MSSLFLSDPQAPCSGRSKPATGLCEVVQGVRRFVGAEYVAQGEPHEGTKEWQLGSSVQRVMVLTSVGCYESDNAALRGRNWSLSFEPAISMCLGTALACCHKYERHWLSPVPPLAFVWSRTETVSSTVR